MIIVECFSDIALVQCLTSTPREFIAHQFRGKSGVCKQLGESRNCKGMVDQDPLSAQHPMEKQGQQITDYSHHHINLIRFPDQQNDLIILCPKLEDWFIDTARIEGIDLESQGLPSDPNKLHRVIDQRLSDFRKVLNMLKSKKSERVETLTSLLRINWE